MTEKDVGITGKTSFCRPELVEGSNQLNNFPIYNLRFPHAREWRSSKFNLIFASVILTLRGIQYIKEFLFDWIPFDYAQGRLLHSFGMTVPGIKFNSKSASPHSLQNVIPRIYDIDDIFYS